MQGKTVNGSSTSVSVVQMARRIKVALLDSLFRFNQLIGLERRSFAVSFRENSVGFPINGRYEKWWLTRNEAVSKNGWHEPSVTRAIEILSHDRNCFVDIGSHLGYFSVLFGSGAGKTAYALELNPSSFQKLSLIARGASGTKGKIVPLNLGMGETAGKVTIGFETTSPGFSLSKVQSGKGIKGTEVPIVSLDMFCEEHGVTPDLIKIDVEGFEIEVWRGGRDVLTKHRPVALIEIHSKMIKAKGVEVSDFLKEISDYGYDIYVNAEHSASQPTPFKPLAEGIPEAETFDVLCVPTGQTVDPSLITKGEK